MTINEMRIITGIPGLGSIPGLKNLASSTSNSEERDELLMLITPHVVSLEPTESTEVWLSK